MKLDELYPYWKDAHDDLLEALRPLTADDLDAKPRDGVPSIRELVLEFLHDERYWISHLVAGNAYERPRADLYPHGAALADALRAAREVTAIVLEPFSREGLRAVRRVPADTRTNHPETNLPVSWLFWHVLEREIFTGGKVALRLEDRREPRRRGL